MYVFRCPLSADAGFVNVHAIYKNFSNDSIVFFLDSKIGEEQSAEDAEDGPPELLVYIGFLMQDEMSYADWTTCH